MEQIIEKLGWKKSAAILITISVVALILLFSSLPGINHLPTSTNGQNQSSTSFGGSSGQAGPRTSPGINNNNTANLFKTYVAPYFQVSYPQNFSPTVYGKQEGLLYGVLLKDSTSSTQIEITAYDKSKNSLPALTRIPLAMGFAKNSIAVGKFQGESYAGGVKGTNLFEQIVFLEKPEAIIKLHLMQAEGASREGQDAFSGLLTSFQ